MIGVVFSPSQPRETVPLTCICATAPLVIGVVFFLQRLLAECTCVRAAYRFEADRVPGKIPNLQYCTRTVYSRVECEIFF